MSMETKPNGHLRRTFQHRGYSLSEVEFIVEDIGPCLGYVVGPDDGYSTLYASADKAVDAHEAALHSQPVQP